MRKSDESKQVQQTATAHLSDDEGLATILAVQREVQAGTEHVLVILSIHAWSDNGAVLTAAHVQLVLAQGVGGQLPCQLDLVVDGAILCRHEPRPPQSV